MKKYKYFTLWEIEALEKFLKEMEQDGYRLDKVKCSYCFYFKKTTPKEVNYFLSYKPVRGNRLGMCECDLGADYNANIVESKMSFYKMYRTKVSKEKLLFFYEVRMDCIRVTLLERALTSLFLALLFLIIFFAEIFTTPSVQSCCVIGMFVTIFICVTSYYFLGYFKQKNKCKTYNKQNIM